MTAPTKKGVWLIEDNETLRNTVARRIALGELPAAPPRSSSGVTADIVGEVLARDLPLVQAREQVVDAFEQRYLERMLAKFGGNVTKAAEASGVARRHFQRLRARAK